MPRNPEDRALLDLLNALDTAGYDFVTPSPETHRRVIERPGWERARDLRGVLGWSQPFAKGEVCPRVLELLCAAGALETGDGLLKSRYRVSRLAGRLYLHSAYPAQAAAAVFLGPDSYRFAALLARELDGAPSGLRVLDIGAGAGVGALTASDLCPESALTLSELNPEALRLARINLAHAGRSAELARTSGLEGIMGTFDLIVANPPYMGGASGRLYRDGGDMHGARMSLEWAAAAMGRLATGGRLVLYTGSAIVEGEDRLKEELAQATQAARCTLRYGEIDPDVFGETMSEPGYEMVERIAAVGAVFTRPA